MTTASDYLRIEQNDLFANAIDEEDLVLLCNFILNIYAPLWMRTHLQPKRVDGPSNLLYARDVLLGF